MTRTLTIIYPTTQTIKCSCFLMVVHTNTYLKCGTLGHPQYKREPQFLTIKTWNVSLLTRRYKCDHPGYTLRSIKMSSEVMENTGTNVIENKCSHNFPLELSYEYAMVALSSLITRQKRGDKSNVGGKYGKMERMSIYLEILGLDKHIDQLNIIHVAGTKGKGSTCTFCEAILRECGFRTGLFTSPHLIDVRERFRVDGLDIPEEKFLQYFWDCWDQLQAKVTEDLPMPPLFQFLTVLAFKIFISEQVNVAIIEVGLGGKKDSTNVIKEPVVCGITSLGMDHVEALGNTLEEIASHKAGIFKPQIPAFTVPQFSEAMEVLQKTSQELKVPLKVAAPLNRIQLDGLKLSLSGDHQLINAGLAISLCKCWLQRTRNLEKVFQNGYNEASLPEPFRRGLSTALLPGRAQIVHDTCAKLHSSSKMAENSSGDLIFYLDGAHSPESIEACARWFSSVVKEDKKSPSLTSLKVEHMKLVSGDGQDAQHETENIEESEKLSKQILLFNCMEVRNPQVLLPKLVSSCASSGTHFSKALFVPSMSTYNKVTSGASPIPLGINTKDLPWQYNLQRVWENVIHGKEAYVTDKNPKMDPTEALPPREFLYEDAHPCSAVIPSLPLAIKWLRDCVKDNPSVRVQVLVTGSLHLVGDVLRILKR